MYRYAVGLVLAGLSLVAASPAKAGAIIRVSMATNGTQANKDSVAASISADGRYVAFASAASNLVPGDTNRVGDVFVHDCQTHQTTRVSVGSGGKQGTGPGGSGAPSISADGRYVAFDSTNTNLVPHDTNNDCDIFVHDRQTGQTSRVSVASDGKQANSWSQSTSISADGRYVAFVSYANNLVPGDTNTGWDAFVRDRQLGVTTRVSVASDGTQVQGSLWPTVTLSPDGRYVAFFTDASNLVAGDTNGRKDVFVHDRQTGQTTRVSVASDGTQAITECGYPSISAGGRYVAFISAAWNLVPGDLWPWEDVFVHDCQTAETARVSRATNGGEGDADSWSPSISADGRYVAFDSEATNLVPDDTNGLSDIFVYDRQTGQTTRVSLAADGTQANGESKYPSISADGRYVAFASGASNLVPGDTNSKWDILVYDRAVLRPDMLVRNLGDSRYRGSNVYSAAGTGQTKCQTVRVGAKATYEMQLQNDGTVDDRFTIGGPGGGSLWEVRYFDRLSGGTERTAEVTGAGWTPPSLAPGSKRWLRVEVTPKPGAAAGTTKPVLVTATSVADATKKDAVKAVTTVAAAAAPAAIAALSAMPVPTGAQLVLSLSAPANIDASVLNLAGRPVRTLCRARPLGAGANTLLWNAQSDTGLPVPGGVYLIQVTATTEDGSQARALAQVRVSR